MCGRFTLRAALESWAKHYGVDERLNLPPRFNVAPTDTVAVVRRHADRRHLAAMRWGLIPPWSDVVAKSQPLINARAETVDEKPSFRDAFARARCLVIADGFYEWRAQQDGSKQAYFMSRGDDEVFAFAGLWSRWASKGGEVVESCCIVTTVASAGLAAIHHRMPVVLDDMGEDLWLDPAAAPSQLKGLLLRPDKAVRARPVAAYVNRVANDDARCLEPPEAAAGKQTQQYRLI